MGAWISSVPRESVCAECGSAYYDPGGYTTTMLCRECIVKYWPPRSEPITQDDYD